MIVNDFQNNQVQGHLKRPSQRKHEGVRTPTARNAIVRDRETNLYYARYDSGDLADAVNSINLRLNALELNQHILAERGVISKPAETKAPAPFVSNVIPMASARKAKEQSKVVHVSQPGNEAEKIEEVHVLPAPEPVKVDEGPPLKASNFEPKFIGKDTLTSSKIVPKPTQDILAAVAPDEDVGDVARLADAYGMDLVEASEILCREYFRREEQCMKHHDKPRLDVKNERYMAKKGMYIPKLELIPYGMPVSKESSGFKAWSREMRAREIVLLGDAAARLSTTHGSAPFVPGEMAYRKKQVIKRAAARPRALPPGFNKVQKVSKALAVDPPVTTDAQVKAITTWTWDVYQKGRRLLGLQPTIRNKMQRMRYELMDEVNAAESKRKSSKVAVPCDDSTPQAELVRRYRRTGIGY